MFKKISYNNCHSLVLFCYNENRLFQKIEEKNKKKTNKKKKQSLNLSKMSLRGMEWDQTRIVI